MDINLSLLHSVEEHQSLLMTIISSLHYCFNLFADYFLCKLIDFLMNHLAFAYTMMKLCPHFSFIHFHIMILIIFCEFEI